MYQLRMRSESIYPIDYWWRLMWFSFAIPKNSFLCWLNPKCEKYVSNSRQVDKNGAKSSVFTASKI